MKVKSPGTAVLLASNILLDGSGAPMSNAIRKEPQHELLETLYALLIEEFPQYLTTLRAFARPRMTLGRAKPASTSHERKQDHVKLSNRACDTCITLFGPLTHLLRLPDRPQSGRTQLQQAAKPTALRLP